MVSGCLDEVIKEERWILYSVDMTTQYDTGILVCVCVCAGGMWRLFQSQAGIKFLWNGGEESMRQLLYAHQQTAKCTRSIKESEQKSTADNTGWKTCHSLIHRACSFTRSDQVNGQANNSLRLMLSVSRLIKSKLLVLLVSFNSNTPKTTRQNYCVNKMA